MPLSNTKPWFDKIEMETYYKEFDFVGFRKFHSEIYDGLRFGTKLITILQQEMLPNGNVGIHYRETTLKRSRNVES